MYDFFDSYKYLFWVAAGLLVLITFLWIMQEKFFKTRPLYWHRGLRRLARVIALFPVGIFAVYAALMLVIYLIELMPLSENVVRIVFLLLWTSLVWITFLVLRYIMTGLTMPRKKRNRKKHIKKSNPEKEENSPED